MLFFQELEKLYFDNGKIAIGEDMEYKKKWIGLCQNDSRFAYSSYK